MPKRPSKSSSLSAVKRGAAGILVIGAVCGYLTLTSTARQPATTSTPLYLDDSPEAWELFQKAQDQIQAGNVPEAVRLYQRLLREFPRRLIPADTSDGDRYVTVRQRVLSTLGEKKDLLKAYSELEDASPASASEGGRVADQYLSDYLTPAGLTAGLSLVQDTVLAGKFESARELVGELRTHPLLDNADLQRLNLFRALIAAYDTKNTSEFSDVMSEVGPHLDGQGDAVLRLAASITARSGDESISVLHYAPKAVTLLAPAPAPVWRYLSGDSREFLLKGQGPAPKNSGPADAGDTQGFEQVGALPVIHDDLVLVAHEDSVCAVDRYDGTLRWRFPSDNPADTRLESGGYNPYDWPASGPAAPAVLGNTVIAAMNIDNPEGEDGNGFSALYCFNLFTGQVVWSVPAGRFGPDFAFARFGGTPMTSEGMVIATLQKRDQSLAGDFLAAINAEDGSVAWIQHVASAGVQGWNQLPTSPPLICGADVIYSSALGAACRVSINTGLVHWLRRFPTDVTTAGFRSASLLPWQYAEPVLAADNLYVMSGDRRRILVIDPERGDLIDTVPATDWGDPTYFVGNGDWLYAIGEKIERINARSPQESPEVVYQPEADEKPLGRILLSESGVFVPTARDIRVLSTTDSSDARSVPIRTPGTPTICNDELIMSTIAGVDSYLPFESGQPQLAARMKQRPDDPSAAISLANLAFRHARWEAILPAVDSAYEAIHVDTLAPRNRDAANRLFTSLLQMGESEAIASHGLGDKIFARLAGEASTPQQRLAYCFHFAQYLEHAGRMSEAVDQYQTVLQDQSLSLEFWSSGGRNVRAGLEAARRIRQDAARSSWGIYDFYEKQATDALAQATTTVDPVALESVIRMYPVADASARAALAEARIHRDAGRIDQAIHAYHTGLLTRADPTCRGELLGELITILRSQGLGDAALNELNAAERTAPISSVVIPGEGTTALAAIRTRLLSDLSERTRLPAVGQISDRPYTLIPADEMLQPENGRLSPDTVLVRIGMKLKAYSAPDLSERWTLTLNDPRISLVAFQGTNALLMQEAPQRRVLFLVDLATGSIHWESDEIDALLAKAGQPGNPAGDDNAPAMASALRRITTLVTPNEIVVANDAGQSACLERTTGRTRWTAAQPITSLDNLVAGSSGLIFAGRRADPTRRTTSTGCIMRVDPADGSLLSNLDLGPDENPAWVGAGLTDEVIIGTASGVYCYDFVIDGLRWALTEVKWHDSQQGFVERGAAYVRLSDNHLAVIGTEHGTPVNPNAAELTLHPNASGDDLSLLPDMVVLKEQGGVFTFTPDGMLQGRLIGPEADDLDIRDAIPCRGRLMVLEERTVEPQPGSAERRAVIYAVDVTGKRIDREFEILPPALSSSITAAQVDVGVPTTIQCIDGWIVLGADNAILGIRAPAEAANLEGH